MITRAEYFDEGSVFKRFIADEIKKVRGIWTAHRFVMENLRAPQLSSAVAEELLGSNRRQRFLARSDWRRLRFGSWGQSEVARTR